uniref:Uncharacterized protein n=1 Tax=Photinus pyralis TaxID=7054 RepID=A0A1Y1LL34_PHOPY
MHGTSSHTTRIDNLTSIQMSSKSFYKAHTLNCWVGYPLANGVHVVRMQGSFLADTLRSLGSLPLQSPDILCARSSRIFHSGWKHYHLAASDIRCKISFCDEMVLTNNEQPDS